MPQPRFIPSSPTPLQSVYNDTGSDIAANLCVMRDASSSIDRAVKLPAAIDSPIMGFTPRTITAGQWGDIVTAPGSIVPLKNTGGVTRGDRLMPQTDGTVALWAASAGVNASMVGIANETAATTVVGEVEISAPGASRQG